MLTRTTFAPPKLRIVKCKQCREPFQKRTPLHTICSTPCILRHAEIKEAAAARRRAAEQNKADRAEKAVFRARKLALKPRKWWLKRAQEAFNEFIRTRDAALPCVSCLRFHQGAYDAGHYLSVGARPELRFDETNVHRQCVPCNQHKGGNLVLYRLELARRIGLVALEALEGPHPPLKLAVADLAEIHDIYKVRIKALKEAGT